MIKKILLGVLLVVTTIFILTKINFTQETQSTYSEEWLIAFEKELRDGKKCNNDEECQKNIDEEGMIAAVCYKNHCLYCSAPINIRCGLGFHGCDNAEVKEALLEKFPDFPFECVDTPISCCKD